MNIPIQSYTFIDNIQDKFCFFQNSRVCSFCFAKDEKENVSLVKGSVKTCKIIKPPSCTDPEDMRDGHCECD